MTCFDTAHNDGAGLSNPGRGSAVQADSNRAVPNRLELVAKLIRKMLQQLVRESSLLTPDFSSFKRQELTFTVLNLLLLVVLLVHAFFSSNLGGPPSALIGLLAADLVANAVHLLGMRRRNSLSVGGIAGVTWVMIAVNMAVAFGLAAVSYRQDIQYFALLIAPLLQAAFRLSLSATFLVAGISDGLIFFWVWNLNLP